MVSVMRLLFAGYGLAAATSGGAVLLGASLTTALGLAWVGGALATLLLASIAAARAPQAVDVEPVRPDDVDAVLTEALRLWEQDRLLDVPASQGRSAAS